MSDIAIKVDGLGKRYRIGGKQEKYKTLRDTVAATTLRPFRAARALFQSNGSHRSSSDFIWALKDVSFEIKRGEVVGIIGRNGAGKSTLLKILSSITEPTEGYADIHGRVGSLLEVGTGFHPELSGRENIYLNGAILGMRRAEIERKFDEIVAFAEVEKFIDTPVKRYSSGMYLRLAFSVAAHLEPEILLVDEVLAVGDAAFQKKCIGKIGDVAKEGRTVFFVSHNIVAVNALCTSGVVMENGRSKYFATSHDAVSFYEHSLRRNDGQESRALEGKTDGLVQIVACRVLNEFRDNTPSPAPFEDLIFQIHLQVNEPIPQPAFGFAIHSTSGVLLTCVNTMELGKEIARLERGQAVVEIKIKDTRYTPGYYQASFWVMNLQKTIHAQVEAVDFEIRQKPIYGSRELDPRYGYVVASIDFSVVDDLVQVG